MNNKSSSIWDNNTRGKVGDFLKDKISNGSNLSIVSAYFTIYAYETLKDKFENIEKLNFIFGEPAFISEVNKDKAKRVFKIEDNNLTILTENRIQQSRIAKDCAEWIRKKVNIRSMIKSNFLHGKMYHIKNPNDTEHAIMGSSNFTKNGLGFGVKPNIELNLELNDKRDIRDLKQWFNQIWNSENVEDVKEEVLKYIEKLYQENSPEFIYYKTLYHIFEKYLDEQIDSGILNQSIGFFETKVWNEVLFDFQKDCVKGAINKIQEYNGCIIADSVGLGKTFEALAVIKYFELLNYRCLVLCPKKLFENWSLYKENYDTNILRGDRFNYDILAHTDLSRENGMSGGIDLSKLNWSNYDLIVIDESHNFKNNIKERKREDNSIAKTRYGKLIDEVIKEGIKTKILLLSATPVNNTLKDLRNQIYLITEEKDGALYNSCGISDIGQTLRVAQKQFTDWVKRKRKYDEKVKDLMKKFDSSFFKLLDSLTIARSRKHIKKFYDINKIGKFPKRLKPISLFPNIDLDKEFPPYSKLNEEIQKYKLTVYNPTNYIKDEYKEHYENKASKRMMNFNQLTREHFLIGMMKINLLKRLESSVESFKITLERTIKKIENLEDKIREFKKNNKENKLEIDEETLDEEIIEEEVEYEEAIEKWQVGKKLKFKLAHLKLDKWLKDLKKDKDQLTTIFNVAKAVTPERDEKLKNLKDNIIKKINNPLNYLNNLDKNISEKIPNKKVVVFTAFADTAEYLYNQLKDWVINELNLHIALVTGGTSYNKTSYKPVSYMRQLDFNNILINFSPRAKLRDKMISMPQEDEIDILIATDCISEGQNLQDCDYVVNYDIHWNPVRIIQRFGRIDRLDTKNDKIKLVNFWPTKDLENYIKLKERVENRMALVNITATADENILKEDYLHKDELKYREQQLLKLKDEIIDLEDMDENISLTEFTLDDFRIELLNFLQENKDLLKNSPLGLYGVVPSPNSKYDNKTEWGIFDKGALEIIKPGVIFCLKQKHNFSDNEKVNPLNPFFLVYIQDNGDIRFNFTSVKQILEIFRILCQNKKEPYKEICEIFNDETKNGSEMGKYTNLLSKSIKAIYRNFKKRNLNNILTKRDGTLTGEEQHPKTTNDFELVTWLVIK